MARPTNANEGPGTAGPDGAKAGAPAPGQLTIKQQREARRAQKIAVLKRQQAKAKRTRLIAIVAGGTAAAAVVVALVVFIVTGGTAKGPASAGTIAGVQTFTGLTANHVSGPVSYKQTPPVGGDHSPVWLNCGVYADPVPSENAVHSLEHSAVWVTYDPAVIAGDKLTTLRKAIPATYAILSPYKGLPAPVVVSAWGAQLKVSSATDPRIAEFIAKYRQSPSAPEPGAACSGGIDGPGKVS
ncbi:MAG: DUF3105 domain-containing protein [Lacisediminihabitans sp.]